MACWTGRHRMVQQPGMVPIGFSLLTATDPTGVITGLCFGAASTADQQMAETFFAVRAQPNRSLCSVGSISSGPYIADKGFEGQPRTTAAGERATGRASSIRPNETRSSPGPSI
jgi:hypothetical protein